MATLRNLIFMELELKHGLTAKEVVEIFMAFLTRLRTILGTIHILRNRFLGREVQTMFNDICHSMS